VIRLLKRGGRSGASSGGTTWSTSGSWGEIEARFRN